MDTSRALVGPGELLAAIPSLLGFTPRDSVVVVSIRHGGELGVILRVDRADCLRGPSSGPLVRAIAGHLARDRATSVVLVSYTTDDVRLACPAIDAIRPTLADAVGEVEAWAVVGGRYFSPGCARDSCCPTQGRAVPVDTDRGGAAVRFHGRSHRDGRAAPDARFDVDEAGRRRAGRAGDRWWARRDADIVAWRVASFAGWESALERARAGEFPEAPATGRLVAALQDRRVRDAVLVSFMPGSSRVARGILDSSADAEVPVALRTLLSPGKGRRPAKKMLAPAWDLLGWITAHGRSAQRAPSLTLAALLAWWEGDDAATRSLLTRAQQAEPGYRLAGLLECTLLAGLGPGWKRAA